MNEYKLRLQPSEVSVTHTTVSVCGCGHHSQHQAFIYEHVSLSLRKRQIPSIMNSKILFYSILEQFLHETPSYSL